jgi:hypothetical protein
MEMKDRMSRVESVVTGLRAAMADNGAKVEEVRREVAGVTAQLSDCCLKLKNDIRNLEQELATLKEEMRSKAQPLAPPAVKVAGPPASLKLVRLFPPSVKKWRTKSTSLWENGKWRLMYATGSLRI